MLICTLLTLTKSFDLSLHNVRAASPSIKLHKCPPLYTPIDDRALDSYRNQSEKMRILRGRCVCDWEDPLINEEVDIYYYCTVVYTRRGAYANPMRAAFNECFLQFPRHRCWGSSGYCIVRMSPFGLL